MSRTFKLAVFLTAFRAATCIAGNDPVAEGWRLVGESPYGIKQYVKDFLPDKEANKFRVWFRFEGGKSDSLEYVEFDCSKRSHQVLTRPKTISDPEADISPQKAEYSVPGTVFYEVMNNTCREMIFLTPPRSKKK